MAEILAFSAEQVCLLTGLTLRQLSYWDQTGFFTPHYADENRRKPFSRVYSFRDVVGLRTIALLHLKHGVPLQELRIVANWLRDRHESPWSSLRFHVSGRRVFFDEPETGARVAGRPIGQVAFPFDMEQVAQEMREATERLRQRTPEDIGKTTRNRYVMGGRQVIAGTRIPTETIAGFHNAGYTIEEIRAEYPHLEEADIRAAIEFEAERSEKRAS